MKLYTSLIALVIVASLAGTAAGVSEGGAQSLYIQPGGRPAGMGDCYVAAADDASAVSWNPAALAFARGRVNFTLMHTQLVPDWDDVYYEYAAYAQRIEGLGTVGFSIIYLTYGEQFATEADNPDPIGTFRSYEVIPGLAYGTTIGENLAVGLGLKFVYVDLAPEQFTLDQQKGAGSSFAADIGAVYRTMGGQLRLGGAVQNVGPRIAYIDEEQSDPLPRNLKLGAAYTLLSDEMNEFMVCGEYNKSLIIVEDIIDQTTGVILNAGAEYVYYDLLAFRLGYQYDEDGDVKGFHFGMGLQYQNFAFNVANVPQAEGLTRPFRFSLTATF
ncbi:MAG: PorV/PorQ family protein [Candidatus Eisenbacteria bacterium]|nr:PorV/PorQ family protein [Candidatus Eisenbacteria bacterium]